MSAPSSGKNKHLYIFLGHFLVGLGVLGMFLPVMPTTIFLLGAAWLYARSSPKFHQWLMNNKILGPLVRDYLEGGGTPLKTKIGTVALLWISLGVTAFLLPPGSWLRILLGVIGISISIHLACIPTSFGKKKTLVETPPST